MDKNQFKILFDVESMSVLLTKVKKLSKHSIELYVKGDGIMSNRCMNLMKRLCTSLNLIR